MKKIIIFANTLLTLTPMLHGETYLDVNNANFLAEKGIISKPLNGNFRIEENITRAELVGIALKISDTSITKDYTCKKYFSDVKNNDWICRAVEIAADKGLISRKNKQFRPGDNITRAEALAILWKASKITLQTNEYKKGNIVIPGNAEWSKVYFFTGYNLGFFSPIYDPKQPYVSSHLNFDIDRLGSRGEIFKFARSLYHYTHGLTINYENINTYNFYGFHTSFPPKYPILHKAGNYDEYYEIVTPDFRSYTISATEVPHTFGILGYSQFNYAVPSPDGKGAYFTAYTCNKEFTSSMSIGSACDDINNAIYYIKLSDGKITKVYSEQNTRDESVMLYDPFPIFNSESEKMDSIIKESWNVAYKINYNPEKKWHAHFWQLLYFEGNKLIINPDIYLTDYICESPIMYRKNDDSYGMAQDLLSLDITEKNKQLTGYTPPASIQQTQINFLESAIISCGGKNSVQYFPGS